MPKTDIEELVNQILKMCYEACETCEEKPYYVAEDIINLIEFHRERFQKCQIALDQFTKKQHTELCNLT